MRGGELGKHTFLWERQRIKHRHGLLAREPHRHRTGTTVVPSVVRCEDERLIGCPALAVERAHGHVGLNETAGLDLGGLDGGIRHGGQAREKEALRRTAVVHALGAQHKRPTRQGKAIVIGLDRFVAGVDLHGHRQIQLHAIAGFPLALDHRKALLHLGPHRLAIHLKRPFPDQTGIHIPVQFAGHKLLTCPRGDAQSQRKVYGLLGL